VNRIDAVFGSPRVLLPVVHPVGLREALSSVETAATAGVRGVFLIDQGMNEHEVLELVSTVRASFPALWIGVNLLSRAPSEVLEVAPTIDGVWSDNAVIDERGETQTAADEFIAARTLRSWRGLYFGGVAFKYQREVASADLGRAAGIAASRMDVVCTSGPGTGKAATVAKVAAMRAGMGDAALGLASGVTVENVEAYLPYVNAFLVGTGIERAFGVLDRARVEDLHAAVTRGVTTAPQYDRGTDHRAPE